MNEHRLWAAGAADRDQRPLEPTGTELQHLLSAVAAYVSSVVDALPTAPASDYRDLAAVLTDSALRRRPPELGRPLADVLHDLDRAAAVGVNPASPGCLAYVPGSGLVSAAIADLVAGVLNRYTGQAHPAPGLVALESDVLRWMADLFAFPAEAMRILTSGASLATFSALVTARTARLGADFLDGTLYVTSQTHHAVAKAARLAGFPTASVREVPVGDGLVRDSGLLRRAHSVEQPAYLQDNGDHGLPDFSDYGPELTRDVRGLRIWLPLQLHGVAAFRSALEEKLELASLAYEELSADPQFDVLAPPTLSIVAFRMRSRDPARADTALAEVLRRVNDERRVLLSSTTINGRYVGRLCVLNHRTDRSRVLEATAALRRHAAAVAQEAF